ncbi:hypothetical protein [Empedobacter sp.]|uniref:hypothetical protein n=1 Tax=Empedobacter sp. TaxID=1927715 RepID=UPI0028AC86AA|nr:hypothetical protein [Empedobacter sp.]
MNKHPLKYLLMFIFCLFVISSCTTDDQLIETTQRKEEKNTFVTFSKNNNLSSKTSNVDFNYAMKFSYLLQRYDSIHNTNISGLINSTNTFMYNKSVKQNFIIENKDFYVESRVFSKVMEEENGDKWIVFPKIRNEKVESFLIGLLSKNETELHFYTFNNTTDFYKDNSTAFQNKFNSILNPLQNKSGNGGFDCGYGDQAPCDLGGVVVTPNPGSNGPGWSGGGGESGGGGCAAYQDCEYVDPDGNGGGNGNSSPNPCEDIKKQINDPDYKAKIDELNKNSILNKKYESGYSQNKNGSFTSITQTTSSNMSDGLIIDINSDLKGLIHTHQNSYETGNFDENGNPEIRNPIKMFSPADVNALMKLAQNQSSNSYSDIYVTMVSSSGVYTLKFTGSSSDIKTGFNTPYWTNEYLNFWKNESGNNETKFLRFLSEKMNVTGVELLKVDKDGKSKRKSLGPNKKVINDDCP